MASIVLLTIVNVILSNHFPQIGEEDHYPDSSEFDIAIHPFEDFGIIPDVIDKNPEEILSVFLCLLLI